MWLKVHQHCKQCVNAELGGSAGSVYWRTWLKAQLLCGGGCIGVQWIGTLRVLQLLGRFANSSL